MPSLIARVAIPVLSLIGAVRLQAGVGSVPVTVQEAIYPGITGLARVAEPVTVGLPLADSAGIVPGSGGNLPLSLSGASYGQFRCLGTWPDGNCKWVLVDTLANISSPGGLNTSISLIDGSGNFGGSNLATDSNPGSPNFGTITINTGTAMFVVRKANFNIIDQAVVGTTSVTSPGTTQGLVISGPVPGQTTCPPCTTIYSSSNDSNSTAILEENGPVKAVVKAMGAHTDSNGNVYMRFTARLFFYVGKSYVRIKVELRNADENTSAFASAYKGFASYEARLSLGTASPMTYAFGGRNGTVSGSYSGSENAYLYQAYSNFMEFSDWNSANLPPNSYYTILPRSAGGGCSDTWCYPDKSRSDEGYVIVDGSNTLESGNRSQYPAGWGDLSNNSGAGVMAGFYYMSGYWPKSIEFNNGGSTVVMGIWPKENPHFYNQAWPEYSVTDFYLDFHSSILASAQNDFLNLQYNLIARAPWTYYNATNVFPYSFPTPTEEDSFYRQIATSANPPIDPSSQCCITDFAPNVFRYYAWAAPGGGNQADFRWAYQLNFLARGLSGRYLWAQNFYHFVAESGLARSDFPGGWRGHSPASDISSSGFPGHLTPANANSGGLIDWIEDSGEHTHLYGIFDWYYATGDESLRDAISQGIYDRYVNPNTSNNTGIGIWNARAVGTQLITDARLHDYLVSIGDMPNAAAAYNIAEKVLNSQVRASLTSPGYDGKNGTDKNRGFQWGCCSYVSWDNPPASTGPGDAASARAAGTFQHSILIEGLYEYLHSRGTSWVGYSDLADLTYGMYSWVRDEMTVPTNSWSPTIGGGGLRYYVAVDYCNNTPSCVSAGNSVAGTQTNNQTLWFPYFWDHEYTGDTSWAGMFKVLLNGLAASSGLSWSENGIYSVSATVYKALHPGTRPALQDINFGLQENGAGSYTLTYTPPSGAQSVRVKWGEKNLVGSLLFDPMGTNQFAIDPGTHQTWWSAHNVAGVPPPTPGLQQSVTINTGITGLPAANFSVKSYVGTTTNGTNGQATATAAAASPANLVVTSGNNQSAPVGQALANPFVVTVTDGNGNPVSAVQITFAVVSGGGRLSVTQAVSNAQGQASSTLTLGTVAGPNVVSVTSGSLTGSPATFTATATVAATVTATGAAAGAANATWIKSTFGSPWPYFRGYNRLVYDPVLNRTLYPASENGTTIYSDSYWAYDSTAHSWTQKTTTATAGQCVSPLGSNPASHPANRHPYHELTYDTTRGQMYLFSGVCQGFAFDDTWAYKSSSNSWSQLSPASSPASRYEGAMAYDAAHDVVVLYGGLSPNPSTDTWQYAPGSNTWTQMSPGSNPGPTAGHTMVYDSVNQKVVLFGGYQTWGGPALNGTWIYDAGTQTWSNPNPGNSPPGLYYPPMAFDSKRGLVVLYGGPSMMWGYNVATNQWSQLPVTGGPAAVDAAGSSCAQCLTMAYDAGTDKYILTNEDTSYLTGTWELSLGSVATGNVPSGNVGSGSGAPAHFSFDLNGDGVVDIVDVQLVIRQVMGLDPCTTAAFDGQCDANDVQMIINYILGK
jgi:YetA-like protein/Galactose oxidase, central domain